MTTSPASRSSMLYDARRMQIVEAAREVIEEHGPGAFTGQIAARAGLARPNVYRHFASRDELDHLVARSAYRDLRAAILEQITTSGTALQVTRAPIAAQVTWAGEHPNLYRFLVALGHQQLARRRGDRGAFAADLAAAAARHIPRFGQDPHRAEATLVALIGMVDASMLHWLDRPTCSREQLIDSLTAQAWVVIDLHLRAVGVELDPSAPMTITP
ncbi:TetR/AcrR family transcriptional regulator [Nocardia salmonicida]|uniref:TetR/AcrR family transcriptional regulator n=1 Tax=Nocardia salmonicida TaxID=53431 RepID=UPI0007A3EC0D|nr:TetR/AcrR family transcriptional regulator [Nocardia salmonicida]